MHDRTRLNLPDAISELSCSLRETMPDAIVDVDRPRDPKGEWWIDISCGDFLSSVAWRESFGFGVFTSQASFAERPDEIYKRPDHAAKRLCQILKSWKDFGGADALWLHDLRQICDTPQTSVAEKMSQSQAAISKLEHREDIRISSLRRYLNAMGGRLEMRAVFDDFSASVDISPRKVSAEVRETEQ